VEKKHPYVIFQELKKLTKLSEARGEGERVILSAYVPRENKTFRGFLKDAYWRRDINDCEVFLHGVVEISENPEKYEDLREKRHRNLRLLFIRDSIEWDAWLYKEK